MAERSLGSRINKPLPSYKFGNNHLLLIGINEYENFPALKNAVKDVLDFKQVLLNQYSYIQDEQDQKYLTILTNQEANRVNIINAFQKINCEAKEEDKVLIYFSGHGDVDERRTSGFWVPVDAKPDVEASLIFNSTVLEYLNRILAKHIFLISDACFSGTLLTRSTRMNREENIDKLELRKSRWILCSGRDDQVVGDGQPGQNSPFATQILRHLRENEDGKLRVMTLIDRVIENVAYNYKQEPDGSPLYGVGHDGGQFIFYKKGNTLASVDKVVSVDDLELKRTNFPKNYVFYGLVATLTLLIGFIFTTYVMKPSKPSAWELSGEVSINGQPESGVKIFNLQTGKIDSTDIRGRFETSFEKDSKAEIRFQFTPAKINVTREVSRENAKGRLFELKSSIEKSHISGEIEEPFWLKKDTITLISTQTEDTIPVDSEGKFEAEIWAERGSPVSFRILLNGQETTREEQRWYLEDKGEYKMRFPLK